MSIDRPSLGKLRLMLGALIAAILLQATPSTPLPTYRDHGSAFSASTSEVAVLLRRDSEEQFANAPKPQPQPVPLLATVPTVPTVAAAGGVRPLGGWRPYRRGPPVVAPVRLPQASPRAPPFRV